MNKNQQKQIRHKRRKMSIRHTVFGVPNRPRLTVYRSSKHIYAQIVDDLKGHTLAHASTNEKSDRADNGGNCSAAADVGRRLAERAKGAGVDAIVFDRNGFRFHGRVKALADAAREAGLKF